MHRLSAKILSWFAGIAYVLLSMLPGGTTLCIGGGHQWSEIIAAHCEHGSEQGDHRPVVNHACPGCEHHAHDHPEPCTDIEAPEFDVRVQQGERQLPALSHVATALPAWLVPSHHSGHVIAAGTSAPSGARAGPHHRLPLDVAASLRSVVLIV
jgi:hypothetical protein